MEKNNKKKTKSTKKENNIKKTNSKKSINKDVKVKKNIIDNNSIKIVITLVVFILVAFPMYYNNYKNVKKRNLDGKYKHICLNKKIEKNNIIYKSMLKECNNNEELSKSDEIISSIKFSDEYKYSEEYYIDSDRDEEYILKPSDIYSRLTKNTNVKVSSKSGIEYKIGIKDDKVLITNLKDNSVNTLFDNEKVKYIMLREYCCDKNFRLIFITVKDEIYVSDTEITNKLNENNIKNIKFEKLSFTDIMNVIVKYNDDNKGETETYAVDVNDNEYRID